MVYKISAKNDNVVIDSVVGLQVPRGTEGERPTDSLAGTIRYNTTSGKLEINTGGISWDTFISGAGGGIPLSSLTDVNITEGTPINGHYLMWDNGTTKWIAQSIPGTGDITFESVMIKGAGSAGDSGLGTIELVPDSTVHASGQYLIIDPTAPNHIHIKAGINTGTPGYTKLIIGDEENNVIVSQADKNVVLSAKATAGTQQSWTFDNDGKIKLPAGGDIVDSTGESIIGFASTNASGFTVLASIDHVGVTVTGNATSTFSHGQTIKFSSITAYEFVVDTVVYSSGDNWTTISLVDTSSFGPVDGDEILFEIHGVTEIYPGDGIALGVSDSSTGKVLTIAATGSSNTRSFTPFTAQAIPDNVYNVLATDDIVLVDSNGAIDASIVLPAAPPNGKMFTVKKTSTFALHSITVSVASSGNIDASAGSSIQFNNAYGWITLVWDNSNGTYWILEQNTSYTK